MVDISRIESEAKSYFAHMNAFEKTIKADKAKMTECVGGIRSYNKEVNKAKEYLNGYLSDLNINVVINDVEDLNKLDNLEEYNLEQEHLSEIKSVINYIRDYDNKLNIEKEKFDELYKASTNYKVKEADTEEEFVIDLGTKSEDNELEKVIDVHAASPELIDQVRALRQFGVEDKYTIKNGESLFDIVKRDYEMEDFYLYKEELLAVCRRIYLDNMETIDAAITLSNMDKEELLKSNKLFTDKNILNNISIFLPNQIEYGSLVHPGKGR